MYIYNELIDNLCEGLNLKPEGKFCQDWELEVTDHTRIQEFIDFYKNQPLNNYEKISLMIIILSSFDDTLSMNCFDISLWNETSKILLNEFELYRETLIYWASYPELDEEDNIEDCFLITPFIRAIIESHKIN